MKLKIFLLIAFSATLVGTGAYYIKHNQSTVPPVASISPVGESLPVTEVQEPLQPKTTVKTIIQADPKQGATIAELRFQVSELQKQVLTLSSENTSLKSDLTALQGQLQTVLAKSAIVPKTKDQLIATYKVSHPFDASCPSLPSEDSRARMARCTKLDREYTTAMNDWVNLQLSMQ